MRSLLDLIGDCGGDEKKAVQLWLYQQKTHEVYDLLVSFCETRIHELERFRAVVRRNADMTLWSLESNSFTPEVISRNDAIVRQRLRAMAGEPASLDDYAEYVKQYVPERYEELCSKPSRVFVDMPDALEKKPDE